MFSLLLYASIAITTIGLSYYYFFKNKKKSSNHSYPLFFSSELSNYLNLKNNEIQSFPKLIMTPLEQYFFKEISNEKYPGHQTVTVCLNLSFKNKKLNNINDMSFVTSKLQKAIEMLQWKHPLLSSVPTLRDEKKSIINSCNNNWLKILSTNETIQFEILDPKFIHIPIEDLTKEMEEKLNNKKQLENEQQFMVSKLIKREMNHTFYFKENLVENKKVNGMFKFSLVKKKEENGEYYLVFTIFHCLCDAIGIKVFCNDLTVLLDFVMNENENDLKYLLQMKDKFFTHLKNGSFKEDEEDTNTLDVTIPSPLECINQLYEKQNELKLKGKIIKCYDFGLRRMIEIFNYLRDVIFYVGLNPCAYFPVKKPFPLPHKGKIIYRKLNVEKSKKLIEFCKRNGFTFSCLIDAICSLGLVKASSKFNSKKYEKHGKTFKFHNTMTCDMRNMLLQPLGYKNVDNILRNYSLGYNFKTKCNINDLNILYEPEKHENELKLIIKELSLQNKNQIEDKFEPLIIFTQLFNFFATVDFNTQEQPRMLNSNIGKIDSIVGRNVEITLYCAGYSMQGYASFMTNVTFTNTKTQELVMCFSYSTAFEKDHANQYVDAVFNLLNALADMN
ncbi:hypothetical protein ABK040_003692 [Willaertia magna]